MTESVRYPCPHCRKPEASSQDEDDVVRLTGGVLDPSLCWADCGIGDLRGEALTNLLRAYRERPVT
jgi:hypothetical protein